MANTTLRAPPFSREEMGALSSLLAARPIGYILLITIVAFGVAAYKFRRETIFACQAAYYSPDRYIASCNGTHYADYEHGAFAFGLEPRADAFARKADVLFLGNSRLQYALSTDATSDWFSTSGARYYLLGFTYFENMLFAEMVLGRLHPEAKVYVINVDNFFDRTETSPAKTILHDPGARDRYQAKRRWQTAHARLCGIFSVICGHQFAIFRSRETGAYLANGGASLQKVTPVSYDDSIDQDLVDNQTAAAIDFLKRFAAGKCVILTIVPRPGARLGDAEQIANRLGMKLVNPGKGLEGLQTWDGYHLDRPSADRWSEAFFHLAGPEIQTCLAEHRTAPL